MKCAYCYLRAHVLDFDAVAPIIYPGVCRCTCHYISIFPGSDLTLGNVRKEVIHNTLSPIADSSLDHSHSTHVGDVL